MTEEEYKAELLVLQTLYEAQKKEVYIRYAKANNPYKIGDIVQDHVGLLKIERIKVSILGHIPECVYVGTELNKDGKPAKKQTGRAVFQSNIIESK